MTAPAPLAASALLLFVLAGCTPAGGVGEGGSSGGGIASGGAATECMSRTWALDIPDSAAQLGDYLTSTGGIAVTQSEGAGVQLISFTEDGMTTSTNDVTYTVTAVDNELTLTVVQTHSGDSTGEWAWVDGGTSAVTFPSWDSGNYTIQTQVLVNGTASPNQTITPAGTLEAGSTMTVECSGDSLTTKVDVSPFTQHWTARD